MSRSLDDCLLDDPLDDNCGPETGLDRGNAILITRNTYIYIHTHNCVYMQVCMSLIRYMIVYN